MEEDSERLRNCGTWKQYHLMTRSLSAIIMMIVMMMSAMMVMMILFCKGPSWTSRCRPRDHQVWATPLVNEQTTLSSMYTSYHLEMLIPIPSTFSLRCYIRFKWHFMIWVGNTSVQNPVVRNTKTWPTHAVTQVPLWRRTKRYDQIQIPGGLKDIQNPNRRYRWKYITKLQVPLWRRKADGRGSRSALQVKTSFKSWLNKCWPVWKIKKEEFSLMISQLEEMLAHQNLPLIDYVWFPCVKL